MMKTIKTKTAKTAFAGFGTACALALAGALSAAPSNVAAQTAHTATFDPTPIVFGLLGNTRDCGSATNFNAQTCFPFAGGVGGFNDPIGSSFGAVYALDIGTGQVRLQFRNSRGLGQAWFGNPLDLTPANILGLGVEDAFTGADDGVLRLEVMDLDTLGPGTFELSAIQLFTQATNVEAAVRIRSFAVSGGSTQMTNDISFTVPGSTASNPPTFSFAGTVNQLQGTIFQISSSHAVGVGLRTVSFRFTAVPLPPAVWGLGASLALFGAVASRRRRAKG